MVWVVALGGGEGAKAVALCFGSASMRLHSCPAARMEHLANGELVVDEEAVVREA